MVLNVKERIVLLWILPVESDSDTLRIVRKLRSILNFTPAEQSELGFRSEANRVQWNTAAEVDVDIPLDAKAVGLIMETFKGLDKDKKLTLDSLAVYERFLALKA